MAAHTKGRQQAAFATCALLILLPTPDKLDEREGDEKSTRGRGLGLAGKKVGVRRRRVQRPPKAYGVFHHLPCTMERIQSAANLGAERASEMRHLLQRYLAVREAFVLDGDLYCSDSIAYSI